MILFWPSSDTHNCTLVPMDEKKIWKELQRSYNRDGYDVLEVSDDQFICPICKNRYAKGVPFRKIIGFMSSAEVAGLK